MQATLRYNPDRTLCEVQIGSNDEDTWGPLDGEQAGHVLIDEDSGQQYYVALSDDEELTAGTVYKLEPLETEVEEDVEISDEEEEDEPEEPQNGSH